MAILLVLAIGNGWSPRIATSCPVDRSTAATPIRPLELSAICAICATSGLL